MDIKQIKTRAANQVQSNKTAVLITALLSSGVIYGATIILSALLFVISRKQSVGISGMLRRNNIESLLSALVFGVGLFSYVWDGCFRGYCRDLYLGNENGVTGFLSYLNRGFRFFSVSLLQRFYQVLWFLLMWCPFLYYGSIKLASQITITEELLANDELLQQEILRVLTNGDTSAFVIGIYIFGLAVSFVFSFFMSYRYRLAPFLVLDDKWRPGPALFVSKRFVKKYRLDLFKMDLSFLWYHAVVLLPAGVVNLLSMFSSFSETALFIMEISAYIVILFIQVFFFPVINTAYAGFTHDFFEQTVEKVRSNAAAEINSSPR